MSSRNLETQGRAVSESPLSWTAEGATTLIEDIQKALVGPDEPAAKPV
jgi:hypothetical protein